MSENDLNGLQNIDLHIEMSEREKAEQKMMDDAKRARYMAIGMGIPLLVMILIIIFGR